MKVKVTKVMAKEIAKAMRKRGIKFEECSVVEMSENEYRWNVGYSAVYDAMDTGDHEWGTGTYKVIRIVYPYYDYACPRYITTKDLLDIFKGCPDKTSETFLSAVCDTVEI